MMVKTRMDGWINMPTSDVLNTLLKLGLALAKHHIKNVFGDEALEVVADTLADVGGEKVQAKVDSIFASKEGQKELLKAAKSADESFKEKCKDNDLRQLFTMDYSNLPSVQNAIAKMPEALDDKTLRETLFIAFRNDVPRRISDEKINEGINLYVECLQSALIPVEDFGLRIIHNALKEIGKDVKDTQIDVKDIKTDVKSLLEKIQGKQGIEIQAREKYLRAFIEKYSAPPPSLIDLGNYEQLPIQLQSINTATTNKKKSMADWGLAEYRDLFSEKIGYDDLDVDDDFDHLLSKDDFSQWGEPNTVFPSLTRANKTHYRFADIHPFPQKFILTGPQGSGKTTLLYKEALLTATHALKEEDLPIPVIIDLLEWRKDDSFVTFIRDLQGDRLRPVWRLLNQVGDFQDLIVSRKVVLYLDGLDEVERDLDQRRLLELKEVVEDLDCQVIMTYRVDNYGSLIELDFPEIAIQPLQIEDIRRFANYRLGAEKGKEFVNRVRVWEDKYQESRDKDLLSLASLPFFLVMMLSYYAEEDQTHIPNRWQLLKYIVRRLWKNTLKTEKGIDRTQIKLYEDADVLIGKISNIALSYLSTKTIPISVLRNKVPETVIHALTEAGLISVGSEAIRFRHTILQDFLAAHDVMDGDLEPFVHSPIFVGMLAVLAHFDEKQRRRVQDAIVHKLVSRERKIPQDNTVNLLWALGETGDKESAQLLLGLKPDNATDFHQKVWRAVGKIANRMPDEDPVKQQIIESIGRVLIDEPEITTGDPFYFLWLGDKKSGNRGMSIGDMFENLGQYTDAAKALAEIRCGASAKILVDGYQRFMRHFQSKKAPGWTELFRREFLLALSKMGKPVVPLLFDLVWNTDPYTATTAAEALSYTWTSMSVSRLLPVLVTHPLPIVRAHVAITLGDLQDRSAVPFLINALYDDGFVSYGSAGPYQGINQIYLYVSDAAASALAQFDSEECRKALLNNGYTETGHLSLELLIERLKSDREISPNGSLRRQWARYAAGMNGGIEAILPYVGHLNRGPDGPCPIASALIERTKIGERPIGAIIKFIDEARDRISRKECVLLLAEIGDLQVEPYLRRLTSSDTDSAIRMTAAGALAALIARFSSTYPPENRMAVVEIVTSVLQIRDLLGASGLGRSMAQIAKNIAKGKSDSENSNFIQSVASAALELIVDGDLAGKKAGLVVLDEILAYAEVYRVDSQLSSDIEFTVEQSPSFLKRRALNLLEQVKYLGVELDTPEIEEEERGFPRREFFIQQASEALRALQKAWECKRINKADWAKDFSEEDWDALGCDDGTLLYLMGKTLRYLNRREDAMQYWTQCIDYYQAKVTVTEKQKVQWVRALLSLQSPTEVDFQSMQAISYFRQAADVVHEIMNPSLQFEVLSAYAFVCRERKEWESVVNICRDEADLTRADRQLRDKHVVALIMCGQAYVAMRDYDSAMREYQKALDFANGFGLLEKSIEVRIWIAILHALNDDTEFFDDMRIISDFYAITKDWKQAARAMLGIGDESFPKNIPVKALVYKSALDYLEKSGPREDPYQIAYALRKLTEVYLTGEKNEEARAGYEHWLDVLTRWNSVEGRAIILTDYAYLLAHFGLRREAEERALDALRLLGPSHEMTPTVFQAFWAVRENPQWNVASNVIWQMLQVCLSGIAYDPRELERAIAMVRHFGTMARGDNNLPERELAQALTAVVQDKSIDLIQDNPYRDAFHTLLEAISRTQALTDWRSSVFERAIELSRTTDPDEGFALIESTPELLGIKGKEILTVLLENAQALRNEQETDIVTWALNLLKLSEERGVDTVLSRLSKVPQIREALTYLTMANTDQGLRRVLNKYPGLLAQETDDVLELAIRAAEMGEKAELIGYLKYHRGLLQHLRSKGTDAAIEDMHRSFAILKPLFEYMSAQTDQEARSIIESHPEILSGEAESFLQMWSKLPDGREALDRNSTAHKRWAMLMISRDWGTKLAFEELLPALDIGEVLSKLLLSASDKVSLRKVLGENPILLSNEIGQFFEDMIETEWIREDQNLYKQTIFWRDFLVKCRELGVDKAIEHL